MIVLDITGPIWFQVNFDLTEVDYYQLAKKLVSDSPGLVDFAIGLVISVFNLPNGQVMFFEEFK